MHDVPQLAEFPLGPIIFLIVMGLLAAIRKVVEQREDSGESDADEWSREDLPEDARRQLYGDNRTIKTARPAREASPRRPVGGEGQARQAQRAPAQRETADDESTRPLSMRDLMEAMVGEGEMVRRREAGQPPPVPEDQAEQARRQEEQRRIREQARQEQEARRRQLREAAQQRSRAAKAQQQRQQQEARRQRRQAPKKKQVREVKPIQRATVEESEPYQGGGARSEPAPEATASPVDGSQVTRNLFGDVNDVRRGIVMMELLGQPRGLRPFEDTQF